MPTTVFPPTPVVFVQTIMNGVVSAAGSTNKKVAFTFNWFRAVTIPAVVLSQVDTAFQAAIAVPIAAALNARYLQTNNALRIANDATAAPQKFAHAVAGAIAGDSMATFDAAYILKSSGIRGAMFKGSNHFGPMSESDSTAGTEDTWNAGALTRLTTIAAAILTGFTDANGSVWVPCTIGGLGTIPPTTVQKTNPNTITYSLVTSCTVQARIGSMNKRKVKSI